MPNDPLDALRKAQSIQPAPPDRGWLSADTPHPYLGAARDVLKGLTGIGDQGPGGVTATNIGQLLGAAIPFTGLPKVRSLGSATTMVDDALEGLGHTFRPGPIPVAIDKDAAPAAQAFVRHMNTTAPPEIDPMTFVRNGSVTSPHIGLPPQEVNIPKGFDVQGGHGPIPLASTDQWADRILKLHPRNGGQQERQQAIKYLKETGLPAPTNNSTNWRTDTLNTVSSPDDLNIITHAPSQQAPPPKLMGRWGRTATPSMGNSKLNEQQIREIRNLAQNGVDPRQIVDHYGLALPTVKDIIQRNSFPWVK